MADDTIELIDTKIDLHAARMPHSNHEDCDVRIAALEARIAELEGAGHVHEDDELEEVV